MGADISTSHHAVLHVLLSLWTLGCLSDLSTLVKVKDLQVWCRHVRQRPEKLQAGNMNHLQLQTCESQANFLCTFFKLHQEMDRNRVCGWNQAGSWVNQLIWSSPDRCCGRREKGPSVRLSVWLSDWRGKCPSVSELPFYRRSLRGRRAAGGSGSVCEKRDHRKRETTVLLPSVCSSESLTTQTKNTNVKTPKLVCLKAFILTDVKARDHSRMPWSAPVQANWMLPEFCLLQWTSDFIISVFKNTTSNIWHSFQKILHNPEFSKANNIFPQKITGKCSIVCWLNTFL